MIFRLIKLWLPIILLVTGVSMAFTLQWLLDKDFMLSDVLAKGRYVNNVKYVHEHNTVVRSGGSVRAMTPLYLENDIVIVRDALISVQYADNNTASNTTTTTTSTNTLGVVDRITVTSSAHTKSYELNSVLGEYYFKFLLNG